MGVRMLVLVLISISSLSGSVDCKRPSVVNIGAVFTYNSTIGRVAKVAIEAAVRDINANSSVLGGTKLNLIMEDSHCSVFIGSIGAFRLLNQGAVAIIGPQSSAIAHMISFVSSGLQVPLVSFAATDPTLSSLQFPFFLRSTLSDSYQMTAIADLICFYQWRQVIAVYMDDDYGRNGISFLDDELAKKMSKVYKIALPVGATQRNISDLLGKSKMLGPRVYVIHVNPGSGLKILSTAYDLHMMTDRYVWLATDWLFATLDSLDSSECRSLSFLQGVIGLRQHTQPSDKKNDFLSGWKKILREGAATSELNVYGLYAYDTVWTVAYALNAFFSESNNISFSSNEHIQDMQRSTLQLGNLRVFDGGKLLFNKLLETKFTGLTGPVQFDLSDRNLMNGTYEIINVDSSDFRTIGYWSNYSHLSVLPPEAFYAMPQNNFSDTQQLGSVTWPGGKKEKPRGWEIAIREKPLKIGVPKRASYVEFVTEMKDTHKMEGYCIDVFYAAQKLIPYEVAFEFVPFGDGRSNPNYYELVKKVEENVFDAAVGDIAIVTNRTKLVDFTQPYIATGLVIVAPVKSTKFSAWVFLKPFSLQMWCVTGAFFFLIGFVIWLLEHRINNDFRGPPRQQLITIFLFSFSTLFKTNQETLSTLGRFVMMVWLFLLMVITSSYTASLTSILTVEQLSSPITGIDSLIASSMRIGFQVGSFAESYLTESLNIHQSRLVSLKNPEEYERQLQLGPENGGVAAIVDELPYVELFLANQSDFGIIGDMFTKNGWGFAFQRDSPLSVDMSTAILRLSENGELQEIHDRWFCRGSCDKGSNRGSEPNHLHLRSFWGLFLICGAATVLAFLVFLLRTVHQFIRYNRKQRASSLVEQQSSSGRSQAVYSFFDFIDEKEEAIKNMFKQHENAQPQ
eukprot:TRINITY_DN3554_c0_g1_i2.p1 TRINITY_DN3554_c0_g1~~TRINITY_DN3554_c0_g1_i2.p1  ORF type:complete len:906 (-),score=165.97 TRINITY_DN3554_c0_g1_i2:220-2937(-)